MTVANKHQVIRRGKKGWQDVCRQLHGTDLFAGKRVSWATCRRVFKQFMSDAKARRASLRNASGVVPHRRSWHELADRMLEQYEKHNEQKELPVSVAHRRWLPLCVCLCPCVLPLGPALCQSLCLLAVMTSMLALQQFVQGLFRGKGWWCTWVPSAQ